jgi:DNA polymerase-1
MILDIETDGLLDECTKIHCIVLRDLVGTVTVFVGPTKAEIEKIFAEHGGLIGHNLQGFDLPVIEKLYGLRYTGSVVDTLVLSHLLWPDLRERDFNRKDFPPAMIGRHSLEAWGYRLGHHKGEFAKTTDWKEFSQEMLDYCIRDTEVTARLYAKIDDTPCQLTAIDLEHRFSARIDAMMRRGLSFNRPAAENLTAKLMGQRAEIDAKLAAIFPPFVDEYETPKTKKRRVKMTAFNPGSRHHIARALREKYGWVPKEFTETGEPKVDESVLEALPFVEAKPLAERFLIQKRLGQLAEGQQNWIQQVKPDGRIHGYCNHNGTVTGRCTHSGPNMAQVPKEPEYRSLFHAPEGWVLVGCDAAALELRLFAHYLARYDNGAYGREVLNGDIHTANQKAAGLPTRAQAKTFIYALLYGAGDAKMGEIVGGGEKEGKAMRAKFMRAIPAYADLLLAVKDTAKRNGSLRGLDGRPIPVRNQHAALNSLLQCAGAVVMKQATVFACDRVQGIAYLVAHVHDEMQFECEAKAAEVVAADLKASIVDAGVRLNLRIPMAGDAKIGRTWAETH